MTSRQKEKSAPTSGNKKSFEDIIERMEQIVEKLGEGNLPLDESLKLFEEGMALSKEGHKILNEAESKIEVLLASGELRPYREQEQKQGEQED